MTYKWTQAIDSGQMAGVCLIDMSAAFDLVDHNLMIEKMSIYGFSESTCLWFLNYLSNRRQCVSINGIVSILLPVALGVPQGSVLGPLLYTLYTNEFPEIIEKEENQDTISCYADDTTLTCVSSDHTMLSRRLTLSYQQIHNFLTSNKLKVNEDKTHLIVISTSKARARSQAANLVEVTTDSKIVKSSRTEKLLGCQIQDDLKWSEYIRNNESSLLKSLSIKLNALKIISKVADFKTRKTIANGIIMRRLSYMITVWSSCSKDLMDSLQVVQNRAARIVTRRKWDTSTAENLQEIGWLSVNQMAKYYTILQLHQVIEDKTPRSIASMFNWDYSYTTRQAVSNKIKPIGTPRLQQSHESFRWRSTRLYNLLPMELTQMKDIKAFKQELKRWTIENIPIRMKK